MTKIWTAIVTSGNEKVAALAIRVLIEEAAVVPAGCFTVTWIEQLRSGPCAMFDVSSCPAVLNLHIWEPWAIYVTIAGGRGIKLLNSGAFALHLCNLCFCHVPIVADGNDSSNILWKWKVAVSELKWVTDPILGLLPSVKK